MGTESFVLFFFPCGVRSEMPYATIEWSGSAWVVKGQVPLPIVESFLEDATFAAQNYKWEAGWRIPKNVVLPLLFDKFRRLALSSSPRAATCSARAAPTRTLVASSFSTSASERRARQPA